MTYEIDGYVYSGDADIRYGGKWIGVDGDARGHVIEVISAGDWDGPTTVITRQICTWTPLADLRRALSSGCGWYDRHADRKSRHAGVLAAYVEYGYADPANEYPDHNETDLGDDPDEPAIIDAVERYAR